MKWSNWRLRLGVGLVALSAVVYVLHFLLFHDAHHIFIYLVGDVAFVPMEVLLVTLILHELLSHREKRAMLQKLNMVIGAFFSEVGAHLLKIISEMDPDSERITRELVVTDEWSDQTFRAVGQRLKGYDCQLDTPPDKMKHLQDFLVGKRGFLLRLLENPNLLEHEAFTDLLWAVFHLTEELAHRSDVANLPESDYGHLAGDIRRAYGRLIAQWLDYMNHLRVNYPYLFSLALRTNPFDAAARVEVSAA